MLRRIVPALVALLAAAAHAQPEVLDPGLAPERVAAGLVQPTTLAFLGPDDFLVLEKATGRVRRVTSGGVDPDPVLELAVEGGGERGLLGIAVHPELGAGSGRDWVYLYYTTSAGASGFVNRLERYAWDADAGRLVSPLLLLDFPSFDSSHNGGALAFGPDGMLYGVVGDGGRDGATQNDELAADVFEDTGVIFRLADDGTIPADNPFFVDDGVEDPPDLYFAYGIRNSFGLAFDPFTGALWDTENGPSSFDEINRVVPGANSGWRDVMGPGTPDPAALVNLPGSVYVEPEYSIFRPVAPTGLAFASEMTTLGAAHEGNLFVADVNLGNVYELPLAAARDGLALADPVADDQAELDGFLFARGFGGITDLEEGPDGALYVVAIVPGEVWRIGGGAGLALATGKAPKRVVVRPGKPPPRKRLALTLVNRGGVAESVEADAVRLDWTSLGACPAPVATLRPPKQGFPFELRPRRKLVLRYDLAFASCANDPLRTRRGMEHGDFDLGATLANGAGAGPLRIDVVEK